MKRADIKLGVLYSNGKGVIRQVTGEGEEFIIYPGQTDCDCLQYRAWLAAPGRKRTTPLSAKSNTTRTSFAAWAKREASDEEVALVRTSIASEVV